MLFLIIYIILHTSLWQFCLQVANTWEYIVSIFKGLNKQLDRELLSSYKEAIVISMNHANPDIKALTQSIFEIKDNLDSTAKCILDEIERPKEKSHPKSDSITKRKTETGQTKEVRIAGSFLNRKSAITKSVSSKPSEKNDKNMLTLPESDSQVNNVYYFMFYIYLFMPINLYIFKFVTGLCVHKNRFEI